MKKDKRNSVRIRLDFTRDLIESEKQASVLAARQVEYLRMTILLNPPDTIIVPR